VSLDHVPVVEADVLVRKMPGCSQAHLIAVKDGTRWVTKSPNNPQGRRTLVNEWLASSFLKHLGIPTPPVAVVNVSQGFLEKHPEAHIQLGTRHSALQMGPNFGSGFPADGVCGLVHDFLPDPLLKSIENVAGFRGALVFDQWVCNSDSRQAIFFRQWHSDDSHRYGFVSQMVDNGGVFEGSSWRLTDSPLRGIYPAISVYQDVRTVEDFQPWLDRVLSFPEQIIQRTMCQIPSLWIEGDEDPLSKLLDQLIRRRRRIPDLVKCCLSRLLEMKLG
jgi:hypothetical protein